MHNIILHNNCTLIIIICIFDLLIFYSDCQTNQIPYMEYHMNESKRKKMNCKIMFNFFFNLQLKRSKNKVPEYCILIVKKFRQKINVHM